MKNVLVKMINKLIGLFTSISTDEFDLNNHVYKEYYETGELKREKPIVRGKRHGIEKCYHKSGKLLSEMPYVNGKRHGISKTYNTNGQLYFEEMWVEDYQNFG